MTPIKVCLLGADGRMGSTFARCAPTDFELVGGVVRDENPNLNRTFEEVGLARSAARIDCMSALSMMLKDADVLVSFSSPQAEEVAIPMAAKMGVPIVSGTTGHSQAQRELIASAIVANTRAVLAPNFSLGAAYLMESLRSLGTIAEHFSIGVVEVHHSRKRDTPSGTALRIREALGDPSGGSIPIASLRLGEVPGLHEVLLSGREELISIRHEVHSLRPFAEGAYLACRWVTKPRRNGIYAFRDVIGGAE